MRLNSSNKHGCLLQKQCQKKVKTQSQEFVVAAEEKWAIIIMQPIKQQGQSRTDHTKLAKILTTVLDKLQSRVPNVDTTKNKSGMTEETKRKK